MHFTEAKFTIMCLVPALNSSKTTFCKTSDYYYFCFKENFAFFINYKSKLIMITVFRNHAMVILDS